MLVNRVQRIDWLDNPLIQILLLNWNPNISMIEEGINTIKTHHSELLRQFKNSYTGTEKDDKQLDDLLAEMHAAQWLIKNGYQKIEKVPRGQSSTPDFQAEKDSESHVFEVKNFRKPDSLLDYLFIKLWSQHLLYPNIYTTQFNLDLPFDEATTDQIDDTDQLQVLKFIAGIHEAIQSGKVQFNWSYQKVARGRTVSKTIDCKWGEGSKFSIMGSAKRFSFEEKNPSRSLGLLVPLIRKTWQKTEDAITQLLAYDTQDAHQKGILINWQKPPDFEWYDDLRDIFKREVEHIDSTLKEINPRLFIRLLGE